MSVWNLRNRVRNTKNSNILTCQKQYMSCCGTKHFLGRILENKWNASKHSLLQKHYLTSPNLSDLQPLACRNCRYSTYCLNDNWFISQIMLILQSDNTHNFLYFQYWPWRATCLALISYIYWYYIIRNRSVLRHSCPRCGETPVPPCSVCILEVPTVSPILCLWDSNNCLSYSWSPVS